MIQHPTKLTFWNDCLKSCFIKLTNEIKIKTIETFFILSLEKSIVPHIMTLLSVDYLWVNIINWFVHLPYVHLSANNKNLIKLQNFNLGVIYTKCLVNHHRINSTLILYQYQRDGCFWSNKIHTLSFLKYYCSCKSFHWYILYTHVKKKTVLWCYSSCFWSHSSSRWA